ncbi:hypothetical protein PINS_up010203 [Pythium insidiosum]|nr:hypothetical protein PINS_up010203 [Pythium insidiosum]
MALVALLLQSTTHVALAQPRPSDTNNQPATRPPGQGPPPTPPPGQPPKPPTPPPGQPPNNNTPPPGQPPNNNTPPPGQPPQTPPPGQTPPPSQPPSTPPPTQAHNGKGSGSGDHHQGTTSAPEVGSTPEPSHSSTDRASTPATASTEADDGGLSAGAIVGIVIACLGLVAVIAFFAYRHMRARREDAKQHDLEFAPSPPMTVLESTTANDPSYAALDAPQPRRNPLDTPADDIVVLAKPASPSPSPAPSSPRFSAAPPRSSPPPTYHNDDLADFTGSSVRDSSVPGSSMYRPSREQSMEFSTSLSLSRESYAESYTESFNTGGSFMQSFDHGSRMSNMSTLSSQLGEHDEDGVDPTANNTQSHWMDAMDEIRDTNDSYAMLEANGSFGSRGSAMRFSNESDLSRKG